jgi:hypothetical protein
MGTNTYEQLGHQLAIQDALVAMFTATDERARIIRPERDGMLSCVRGRD